MSGGASLQIRSVKRDRDEFRGLDACTVLSRSFTDFLEDRTSGSTKNKHLSSPSELLKLPGVCVECVCFEVRSECSAIADLIGQIKQRQISTTTVASIQLPFTGLSVCSVLIHSF
uniref:AsnC_trans_reg domain-containing protein n=1 Tax=Ascaris lumbricoides TaxID=6252 RepID=A0A0M3I2E7_ASCLU